MRPTLHLGLPSGVGEVRWAALSGPIQGFDALRILSQILSLQALHYLVLALILPSSLALLTFNKYALDFQGGVASLSLMLDWREIAGDPIVDGGRAWPWNRYKVQATGHDLDFLRDANLNTSDLTDGAGNRYWWEYEAFLHADSAHFIKIKDVGQIAWEGRLLGTGSVMEKAAAQRWQAELVAADSPEAQAYAERGWWYIFAQDASRGWVIAFAWALTGAVDVFLLSTLIRRPTHILDHAITLHLIHLSLTWFYTRNFPTSLFYWMVMAAHVGATVVWAEALSIRREMRAGWQSGLEQSAESGHAGLTGRGDEEHSRPLDQQPSAAHGGPRSAPHVLFDDDEDGNVEDDKDTEKKRNGHAHGESIEMKRLD